MLHFPTEFPTDALKVLVPVIRSGGKIDDKVAVGEATLTLQGYGMGLWLRHAHVVGASAPDFDPEAPVDAAEAAACLLELESAVKDSAAKFNFKKFAENAIKIVKFILPLLIAL